MGKKAKIIAAAGGLLITLMAIFLAGAFRAPSPKKILWGVNFSQMQAQELGLDWKQVYAAMLSDLGAKHLKIMVNWDFVEGRKDAYYFEDVDWQVQQAELHNADLILVLGMKSGRWPECHVPGWANGLDKRAQQQEILGYLQAMVSRYKGSGAVTAWQVENEPLFDFGQCPWYDQNFLKQEVRLVKSLDPLRPVIVSDSGEQSLWWKAAQIGDIVGTTMYRKVWFHIWGNYGFYLDFPLPPATYWLKAQIVEKLFGKKVINIELQAEPWAFKLFEDVPLEEQAKTMNPVQFQKNVEYAKKSGLDEFYFWGTEWWYWLKEKQNQPQIWNEAKSILQQDNTQLTGQAH